MKKYLLTIALLLLPTMALAQQPSPSQEFNLKVRAIDVDKIGKALGKLPFEDVAELMQNLRQQIATQQAEMNKPVENKPDIPPNKEPDK